MELPRNLFKAALLGRQRLFGTWLMMDSPVAAEALAFAGLDFLVVDTEHAPGGAPEARAQLQAIAGGTASAVVRLPDAGAVTVKKILDIGAQTVMFPMIVLTRSARAAAARLRAR
ncbi:MAG: aldolase/citrate lyase family protein [Betaproteobacteria bacterium]